MKVTRTRDIRMLLETLGVRPSKALGQNFLCDENFAEWMVREVGLGSRDVVLEIGPGLGALTERLAERVQYVTAIEADARLCQFLQERFRSRPNVHVIYGDALKADWTAILAGASDWVLLSNLPYHSGTRMLMRLFDMERPAARAWVTLQKDVAERLVAVPGSTAYGLLSLRRARWFEARLIRSVPSSCFYPTPKVVSAVVELRRRNEAQYAPRDFALFRELTRCAFMHRRKQMKRILPDLPAALRARGVDPVATLRKAGIPPEARPEELDGVTWGRLADLLAAEAPSCD